MRVLIYGMRGWIGEQMKIYLMSREVLVMEGCSRCENYDECMNEIERCDPTHVMCMIGRTHGRYENVNYNTIDYLELPEKLNENIRDNMYGPMNLGRICDKKRIHYTYMGTGCIYDGYEKEYEESDESNYVGSSYSIVKSYTDKMMSVMNVLNLRIRMPISSKISERNFITKITRYSKICSKKNSMTILDDYIPIFYDMMKKNIIGTYNCTNKNGITHNEILEMYRNIVDNDFKWDNFTIEEQNEKLLCKRSNNVLSTKKIEEEYEIDDIRTSLIRCLKKYKENKDINDIKYIK